jgi:hypothetical protein
VSGALLCIVGVLLILRLPVTAGCKSAIAVFWLALNAYEWFSYRLAYARAGILRIDAGGRVERHGDDGAWQVHALRAGSVVLPRLAWLRLSAPGGLRYSELLCGDARESDDWRRFQVIWRHVGATG